MNYEVLYIYDSRPLKAAEFLRVGEKYVSSKGDVFLNYPNNLLKLVKSTPLSLEVENNTVENLTELQLEIYWRLCNTDVENGD